MSKKQVTFILTRMTDGISRNVITERCHERSMEGPSRICTAKKRNVPWGVVSKKISTCICHQPVVDNDRLTVTLSVSLIATEVYSRTDASPHSVAHACGGETLPFHMS